MALDILIKLDVVVVGRPTTTIASRHLLQHQGAARRAPPRDHFALHSLLPIPVLGAQKAQDKDCGRHQHICNRDAHYLGAGESCFNNDEIQLIQFHVPFDISNPILHHNKSAKRDPLRLPLQAEVRRDTIGHVQLAAVTNYSPIVACAETDQDPVFEHYFD